MQNSCKTAFRPFGNHGRHQGLGTHLQQQPQTVLFTQPALRHLGDQCPATALEQTHTDVTDHLLRAESAWGLGGRENISAA